MNIPSKTNGSIKRTSSIISENPLKSVRIDLSDYFFHERPFSNLKVILNNQIIWCDKASLSSVSPIIREEIIKLNQDESLIFHDIDLKDFLSMLEFIYPIFNPEINEKNISSLIELSDRFQFDMLKHACQIYVRKYLTTIRRVFNNYHHTHVEGDYFLRKNSNQFRAHDLIQFNNQTCVDALNIVVNLCRWLKIYYKNNSIEMKETIISVLQQISVDYLQQALTIVDINDQIKTYIYKQRAHYLEQISQIKHI